MKNLKDSQVTKIQFFNESHEVQTGENEFETVRSYTANIVVDEELVIQLSGNDEAAHPASIPTSNEQYHNNEEMQDWAFENIKSEEVEAFLKEQEIENNFDFLAENADETY